MSNIRLNEVQKCKKCGALILVNDYDDFSFVCYSCVEDYSNAIHKSKWDLTELDFMSDEEKSKWII